MRVWQPWGRAGEFERCVGPHLDRLWRLALRLQRQPDDAEDLLQDLLQRAWRHRATVLALDAPAPWLARVLYRLHVDRWRRRGILADADPLDENHPLEIASEGQESAGLKAATVAEVMTIVQTLPEPQRVVLLMHDAEGYTLEEIGRTLDVPIGTLKSRLHRARRTVQIRMHDGTF